MYSSIIYSNTSLIYDDLQSTRDYYMFRLPVIYEAKIHISHIPTWIFGLRVALHCNGEKVVLSHLTTSAIALVS
jgi:hypothetical protein